MDHKDFYEKSIEIRKIIKRKTEEIECIRRDLKALENNYQEQIYAYRRESVNRVLDFIQSEYRAGRICNLGTLLCHCQNKLNGNIDGIEIDLEKHRGVPFNKSVLPELENINGIVYVKAIVKGENASGQKLVKLVAQNTDGIKPFYTDNKDLIVFGVDLAQMQEVEE